MVNVQDLLRELRADAARILERSKAVALEHGISAREQIIDGSPAEEIVRAAGSFDLAVMGSHGRGFLKRLILGSVTQAVLHRVAKPLLVVHCVKHSPTA
jgi:nucleotide-binding universal stress UspA family protein